MTRSACPAVRPGYAGAIRAHLAPLRAPAFARLLSSYTLNSVGDYVGLVALAVLVYAQTRSPLATSALFIAARFLPAFAAPVATARLDQLGLRIVLPLIHLAEALIFALLALVAVRFSLPAVLALALADGVLMLTARGLTRGAVNSVLAPRGLLRAGNGLINVGFALSGVVGAALGGLLVDRVGVSAALAVDAASFVGIAALLATCRSLPAARAGRERLRERVRAGLRHVRGDPLARMLIGGEALALVFFTSIVPIEIVYAEETLGTDEAGYGLLLSAWGAGILLGSLLFMLIRAWSALTLIVASTLSVGVAYLGMAATTELWVACAFSLLGGLGNGIQWVSVMTALQEATPGDLQARVTSLLESVAAAMTGAGFLIGGIVVSLTAPPVAFALAGLGVVGLVAAGVALRLATLARGGRVAGARRRPRVRPRR